MMDGWKYVVVLRTIYCGSYWTFPVHNPYFNSLAEAVTLRDKLNNSNPTNPEHQYEIHSENGIVST